MIYILGLLGIGAAICLVTFIFSDKTYRGGNTAATIITSGIVSGLLIFIPLICSYDNYLDQRAFYDSVVSQYRDCVSIYKDSVIIDITDEALTDLRYQGYQESIAEMIKDLRTQVARYNKGFIKKQRMDENVVFSWLIIAPDKDMKLLRMRD